MIVYLFPKFSLHKTLYYPRLQQNQKNLSKKQNISSWRNSGWIEHQEVQPA